MTLHFPFFVVVFRWKITDEKLPHHSHFKNESEFPAELRLSAANLDELLYTKRMM